MNKKHLVLIIFSVIITFILGYCPKKLNNLKSTSIEQNEIKPNLIKKIAIDTEMPHNYHSWLAQREKEVWQELAPLGITKESCEALKTDYVQTYKQCTEREAKRHSGNLTLSEETKKLVYSVLDDFNIDKTTVTVLPSYRGSSATCAGTNILINEKLCNEYGNKNAVRFVIGHELIHLIHQDDFMLYIIRDTLTQKNIADFRQKNVCNKFQKFFETRADILAALKNLEYAQGAVACKQLQLAKRGDPEYPHYPKNSVRLAHATNILHIVTHGSA